MNTSISLFLKEPYKLETIQVNGQSMGQNGTTHIDNAHNDGRKTLMVFINFKWQKEWGGEFHLLEKYNNNSKIVKNIEYIPGRIILFDGNIPHRGLAPTKPYIIRKSLVFRLSKYEYSG
jgi:Rps23 Pro-64 3,4-dihydroxylase Tpa1-like proline 4-hydroxylase